MHLIHTVPNTTLIRRQNALALFQRFVGGAITEGASPKGLEQSFAAKLQISPSMWSQIKSARPVGDKLARQLEVLCEKPLGWLDLSHGEAPSPDAAEERFMELARRAWRGQNARGKRELLSWLKGRLPAPEGGRS